MCVCVCMCVRASRKATDVIFLMNPQLQNHDMEIRKLHQNGVWASGENPLQSDQAATNSSRRQNTILVNTLKLRVMIFELRVRRDECGRGEGGLRRPQGRDMRGTARGAPCKILEIRKGSGERSGHPALFLEF